MPGPVILLCRMLGLSDRLGSYILIASFFKSFSQNFILSSFVTNTITLFARLKGIVILCPMYSKRQYMGHKIANHLRQQERCVFPFMQPL